MIHKCRVSHNTVFYVVLSILGKRSPNFFFPTNIVLTLTSDTAHIIFEDNFFTMLIASGENMFRYPISHDGIHLVTVSVRVHQSLNPCALCLQEAAVFLFEKKIADKLHKPKRREMVTEMLRTEVKTMSRIKHPRVLRVLHPLEECQ